MNKPLFTAKLTKAKDGYWEEEDSYLRPAFCPRLFSGFMKRRFGLKLRQTKTLWLSIYLLPGKNLVPFVVLKNPQPSDVPRQIIEGGEGKFCAHEIDPVWIEILEASLPSGVSLYYTTFYVGFQYTESDT